MLRCTKHTSTSASPCPAVNASAGFWPGASPHSLMWARPATRRCSACGSVRWDMWTDWQLGRHRPALNITSQACTGEEQQAPSCQCSHRLPASHLTCRQRRKQTRQSQQSQSPRRGCALQAPHPGQGRVGAGEGRRLMCGGDSEVRWHSCAAQQVTSPACLPSGQSAAIVLPPGTPGCT